MGCSGSKNESTEKKVEETVAAAPSAATPASAAPASAAPDSPAPPPVPVPDEISALLKSFTAALNGDAEAVKASCTDDCMFNPPGAPPMPMEAMMGMMAGMKSVWPDWTSRLCFIEAGPDADTFIVGTQQVIGVMKGDFPAMGPFPAVAMADVPERCKKEALTLPVEVGTYKIKDGKVASGSYKPNGEFRADWKANGGLEPDAFSLEWWPQGMVGFGLVFKWFDKLDLLPAPPAAAPANADSMGA